ncbi:MalY/PatB family protein [Nocardioides pantholopis]|uniref:MalY/PatB family protein n=1 Tax=Nocardioides pantholopis TaxID=2483798 RepID=UPI000F08D9CF|nr:aminotransferase class I/II-fold pyridoxal phosphate-dependent enzyme [Nocardioides pantholopis]
MTASETLLRDLSDDEARAALPLKWGSTSPDVLPAWVAEMDYAVAEPVRDAVCAAVLASHTGYPALDAGGALGTAYAGFAERRFGQRIDPALVLPVVDVTAGIRLVLDVLCDPAPVVVPLPAYPPQLAVVGITGRERWDLPVSPDAERAGIDLDRLDALLAAGARTVLLTQPHNPCGHVYTRTELEGVRDLVLRHGARVISDEIHAPLVLPGATHVPYLSLPGTAEHAVALVSASKAFNVAGLRCAQVLCADPATHRRLAGAPEVRNDSWSPLGVVGAIAAYRHGDAWLDALLARLDDQRALLGELLATELPQARWRRPEATYLAWLDLRGYGVDDPTGPALRHGVRLSPGTDYHPGLPGHLRLNFATSPERLTEAVRRLAVSLGSGSGPR